MKSNLNFLKEALDDVIWKIYPELKDYEINLEIKHDMVHAAEIALMDLNEKRVIIHVDEKRVNELDYIDWFLIFCHELAHIILGISWQGTENMSLYSNKLLSDLIEATADLIALSRLLYYAHHRGELPEEILWRALEELTIRISWVESLVQEDENLIIHAINSITDGKFKEIAKEYLKKYTSTSLLVDDALAVILKSPFKLLSFYLILSKTLKKDYDEVKWKVINDF